MNKSNIRQKSQKSAAEAILKIKGIISDLGESERATLELLLDKDAQAHIAQSRKKAKRGEFITLEEFVRTA